MYIYIYICIGGMFFIRGLGMFIVQGRDSQDAVLALNKVGSPGGSFQKNKAPKRPQNGRDLVHPRNGPQACRSSPITIWRLGAFMNKGLRQRLWTIQALRCVRLEHGIEARARIALVPSSEWKSETSTVEA